VKRILIIKTRRSRSKEYLIRWKNFSPVYDLWQSEENLSNASNLIKQFWNNRKSKIIILPPKMNLKKKFQKIPQKLNNKKDPERFRKRKF
jgi:hypothetical protein